MQDGVSGGCVQLTRRNGGNLEKLRARGGGQHPVVYRLQFPASSLQLPLPLPCLYRHCPVVNGCLLNGPCWFYRWIYISSARRNGRSLFRAGLVGYIMSTLVPFMKLRAGIYLLSFITPWEVRWRAEEDDTNIDTGSYYIYYDTKYYKH